MAKMKQSSGFHPLTGMTYITRPSAVHTTDEANHHERGHMFAGPGNNLLTSAHYESIYGPTGLTDSAPLYPGWTMNRGQQAPAHDPLSGPRFTDQQGRLRDNVHMKKGPNVQITNEALQEPEDVVTPQSDAVHTIEIDDDESESPKSRKASTEKKQPKVLLKTVRIDELEDNWYWMFDALTQKGVKTILHAWISYCHPAKQTHYPYKGNKKVDSSTDADAYHALYNQGYHTAPDYWPNQEGWYKVDYTACRHLEPYHIYKNERQFLAKHLLLLNAEKGDQYQFNLKKLRESTDGITKRMKSAFPEDAHKYLEAIYTAAQKCKDLQDPNVFIDPSTTVSVYMSSQKNYKVKSKSKRSGREYFYGSRAKKRHDTSQAKASPPPKRQRSSSEDSVMTDVKPDVSAATSRMTTPDEDIQKPTASLTASTDSLDEAKHHFKQDQAVSDYTQTVNAPQATQVKDEVVHLASGFHTNPYSNGRWVESYQPYVQEQAFDYAYMSDPSPPSTVSSFDDTTPSESVASGSYSPYATTHGYNYAAHYPRGMLCETQVYPTASVQHTSIHGFGASTASDAYGPQQGHYAQHGMAFYNDSMTQHAYRRNSDHYPYQQCATTWG